MVNILDKRYVIPSHNYFSGVATVEPYLSLTIHYIDCNFTLKSGCLQT